MKFLLFNEILFLNKIKNFFYKNKKLNAVLNMSHIEELKGESLEIHNKIIELLEYSGVEAKPNEIITNCLEAIKKLYKSGNSGKASSLLSILTCYRDSIVFDDLLFSVIKLTLNDFPSLTKSIIKSGIRNTENWDFSQLGLFLSKNFNIKGVRYILRKYSEQLKNSENDMVNEKTDLFELFKTNKEKCMNFEILKFLKNRENVSNDELLEIIANIKKNGDNNLQILMLLYKFYRNNQIEYNVRKKQEINVTYKSIICPRLVELTEDEMFLRNHSEKILEEFVGSFSDFLFPNFISLIYSVNLIYMNEGKMSNVLRAIIKYIKLEKFIEIVKPLDAKSHFILFKDVTNADIGTFIMLYNNSSDNLNYLMPVLVGFSTFCTDHNHNIEKYLDIMKEALTINFRIACTAIEKLINSHMLNIESNCLLPNPIPKDDSKRILNAIKLSKIHDNVINLFLKDDTSENCEVIKLLANLSDLNFGEKLLNIILGREIDERITLYKSLKLMRFFIDKVAYNFEFINRLLEICVNGNSNEQKLAYSLLAIIKTSDNLFCICDLLFTNEMLSVTSTKSKNRLALLYAIFSNKCQNHISDNFIPRFYTELLKFSVVNNIKSRKFASEIIFKLQENSDLRQFVINKIKIYNNDINLLTGALKTGSIIINAISLTKQYISENQLADTDLSFINYFISEIFDISFSYELIVKHVLDVFSVYYSLECCKPWHSQISDIMKTYIKNYSKKFNTKLKECVLIAKNNKVLLNKEMKLILRYKNKAGKEKNIQVIKNN